MKKIVIFLALMVVGWHQFNVQAKASGYENLFDLSKFKINTSGDLYNESPIMLEINTLYTLVMAKDTQNQAYDYYLSGDMDDLVITNFEDTMEIIVHYYIHKDGHLYYEFETKFSDVMFVNLTYAQYDLSSEIILYKGSIEDFKGYYPYQKTHQKTDSIDVPIENYHQLLSEINSVKYQKNQNELEDTVLIEHNILNQVGTYYVKYRTNLIQGAYYYFDLGINLVDISAPVIESKTMSINLSNKIPINELINRLVITDNTTNITAAHIKIIKDEYSDAVKSGDYVIRIQVQDDYQNQVEEDIVVTINKDIKPIIVGPHVHFYYVSQEKPTLESLLSIYKAYDGVTKETLEITVVSYTYNHLTNKPGRYTVYIQAIDDSNNKKEFVIVVQIVDDFDINFVLPKLMMSFNKKDKINKKDVITYIESELNKQGIIYKNLSVDETLLLNQSNEFQIPFSFDDQYDMNQIGYLNIIRQENRYIGWYVVGFVGMVGLASLGYWIVRKKRLKRKLAVFKD